MSPDLFVSSEWISRNLKYTSSLPRCVRRTGTLALQIPAVLQFELGRQNSLQQLATFKLPTSQILDSTIPTPALNQFFSVQPPSASNPLLLSQLLHLPIPDEPTIHAIFQYARQAWLSGAQSICYAHLAPDNLISTHFPLGTVTWWREVIRRRSPQSQ
ncbi:hypothetical protein BDZ89DRAFT_1141877 [Hymenopellis radicata]|nr:hypothetical protein BDZ89DRAFT_1141877 [Hymenopellis radicata]